MYFKKTKNKNMWRQQHYTQHLSRLHSSAGSDSVAALLVSSPAPAPPPDD